MKHYQRIGKWGEEKAKDYLILKVIGHNIRPPYGEIDIIAKQNDTIIFFEVKTRKSNKMGLPEESITPRKQEYMIAYVEHYAMENEIDQWQIDVISIEGKPGSTPKITYFENAI